MDCRFSYVRTELTGCQSRCNKRSSWNLSRQSRFYSLCISEQLELRPLHQVVKVLQGGKMPVGLTGPAGGCWRGKRQPRAEAEPKELQKSVSELIQPDNTTQTRQQTSVLSSRSYGYSWNQCYLASRRLNFCCWFRMMKKKRKRLLILGLVLTSVVVRT